MTANARPVGSGTVCHCRSTSNPLKIPLDSVPPNSLVTEMLGLVLVNPVHPFQHALAVLVEDTFGGEVSDVGAVGGAAFFLGPPVDGVSK